MKYKVSVLMLAYNHEKYIGQAIDSVLAQKCDFPIELVIGEDRSSDKTRQIIEGYAEKYPDIINPVYHEVNVGPYKNQNLTMERCRGEFIAMLEGDDYWIDPLKLQKQVDFLESHPNYSMVVTDFSIYNENTGEISTGNVNDLLNEPMNKEGFEITKELALQKWVTKTLTILFRRKDIEMDRLKTYRLTRDYHLIYELLRSKPGFCLNEVTGHYRVHDTGVWSTVSSRRKEFAVVEVLYDLYKKNPSDDFLHRLLKKKLKSYINSTSDLFYLVKTGNFGLIRLFF